MRHPVKNESVTFNGKKWNVVKLACGYLWRITCGDEKRTINYETLLQLQHGK